MRAHGPRWRSRSPTNSARCGRFVFFTSGIMYMFAVRESDVLYDPLPLYHSAGGMLGVGIMLTHGSTVVVRRRFTASGYWRDVSEHGCTVRPTLRPRPLTPWAHPLSNGED